MLNFPSSPTNGQTYPQPPVSGQSVYTWDGEKWKADAGAGIPTILIADTPPANPPDNALWWESDSGLLYLRYNDGTSTQWVIAAPQPDTSVFATTDYVNSTINADKATAAQYIANSAPTKTLTGGAVWQASNQFQLTDAATVTPDFSLGIDFQWTIGATGRTLANPTNAKPGQKGLLVLRQDSTGSRTITTWGSSYWFAGGTKPTLSTTGFAWDVVSYFVLNSSLIFCTFSADFK